MKSQKFFFVFLFLASFTFAQESKDPVEIYMKTITANDAKAHLTFLASDELEGRETTKRGQKVAAMYLATQFMRMGLTPVVYDSVAKSFSYFQKFQLDQKSWDNVSLTVKGKKTKQFTFMKDFYLFPNSGHNNSITGNVVFAGYGIEEKNYNDFVSGKDTLDMKGKIVLILNGEPMKGDTSLITGKKELSPWSTQWRQKLYHLRDKGAVGVLIVVNHDISEINIPGSAMQLHSVKSSNGTTVPVYYVSPEIANTILAENKITVQTLKNLIDKSLGNLSYPLKKTSVTLFASQKNSPAYSENVLGYLKGTDKKDEVVIITAHYDHLGTDGKEIWNGADDDGSGTTAVLEIAEAFSIAAKNGFRPRRSILFMPVAGEEKGLLGSSYYSDHPVFLLEKTVADLNIDMIGRIDPKHDEAKIENYTYIIGSDKLSTELHQINEEANKKYTHLDFDYEYNRPDDPNRFYYRSDHYSFAKHNIPVIFYFTGVHKDYHQPTDEVDKIHFDKIEIIARLVFATAWELANREEKIKVDVQNDFPNGR